MNKKSITTVWLRLIYVFLILVLISAVLWVGSRRSPYSTCNIGRALTDSALVVVTGPVFPLFIFGKLAGILGTIVFWIMLLGLACRSRQDHARRWFYILFGIFIVMTLIWIPLLYYVGSAFVLAL